MRRTCSTSPATCSRATASRPGCCPSTCAPPTGGSNGTSTTCCAAAGSSEPVRLPSETLILDRYGLARELSLPIDAESWHNDLVSSYRLDNGVLHNPVNDRRTTQGVFHVAEGGLPIPADKLRVPLATYLRLLDAALRPPAELLRLPFTANWPEPVETMVSLLLRPLVCPAVPKSSPEKRTEVRFFVPGGLVSNLDFVESIFGNAGDPYLPGNDAALDVDGWTGHSGCVILAPHLTQLRKKDVGLPHASRATDAERAAGMCWEDEGERYNNGSPFKITSRGIDGVMVTILADNYFGYCKKEVKTQIGYSANLFGLAEEEHAGGALAFATFSLGDRFVPEQVRIVSANHRFAEVLALVGERATVPPLGLRDRRGLSRDPLHARGHGDRRPPPGHPVGEQGPGTAPQAPARPDLHPSERLQDPHGQAPRGAELAADRDRAGGRLLP